MVESSVAWPRRGRDYDGFMRESELYRAILGLESPWAVARVELDVKQHRVDVYADHVNRKSWACPECEAACGLHDHDEERMWRHLDSCQFQTVLHASVPRVRCNEHCVRQVRVPWAEPRSRFILLFERFAVDELHEADVLSAARILAISWDEAHGIMARAVARGLLRRQHTVPECVGVDEKSIARSQTYATIACDMTDGRVIDVAPPSDHGRVSSAVSGASSSTTWPASRLLPWTCGSRSWVP